MKLYGILAVKAVRPGSGSVFKITMRARSLPNCAGILDLKNSVQASKVKYEQYTWIDTTIIPIKRMLRFESHSKSCKVSQQRQAIGANNNIRNDSISMQKMDSASRLYRCCEFDFSHNYSDWLKGAGKARYQLLPASNQGIKEAESQR